MGRFLLSFVRLTSECACSGCMRWTVVQKDTTTDRGSVSRIQCFIFGAALRSAVGESHQPSFDSEVHFEKIVRRHMNLLPASSNALTAGLYSRERDFCALLCKIHVICCEGCGGVSSRQDLWH